MTHSFQAIVLNATKTGEKSLVVHTVSARWGRRSFITTIGKSSPMALFLPFNILDVEVSENDKSDLWRLRNVSAAYPLTGIRTDVRKNAMTMFMSEVLYRSVKDGACEDSLYEWCRGAILTLDALDSDFSNYHLHFLLEYAQVLGFRPSLEDVAPFAGEEYGLLSRLLGSTLEEFLLVPLSGRERSTVADVLLRYLSYHTESAINVRSLQVLGELFR